MSRYASSTDVPTDRTKAEIEKTLLRYGADDITMATSVQRGRAGVAFVHRDIPVKINVPLPDRNDKEFRLTDRGRKRVENQVQVAWEQACRQRWRALLLLIKANLESIELGVLAAEDVWLPWMMLPGGQTVSEKIRPHLAAIRNGTRALLPGPLGE